jgi:hypothetical protein
MVLKEDFVDTHFPSDILSPTREDIGGDIDIRVVPQ